MERAGSKLQAPTGMGDIDLQCLEKIRQKDLVGVFEATQEKQKDKITQV